MRFQIGAVDVFGRRSELRPPGQGRENRETGICGDHAGNRIKRRFDPSKQIAADEGATASIRFEVLGQFQALRLIMRCVNSFHEFTHRIGFGLAGLNGMRAHPEPQ